MALAIVSRRNSVMNSNNQERLLAKALPHGIVVLRPNGDMQWWNSRAAAMLGITDDNEEQNIQTLIPAVELSELIRTNTEGVFSCIAPNNADLYYSFSLSHYGKQRLVLIQDITHTHRLEAMRQDFIANVSHELRTPLTVFHGFLEILQDKHNQISNNKLDEIYQQMYDQCQRMETLVQDLLWLARLESAEPDLKHLQSVPVAVLIRQICDDAQKLSGENQHQFTLELDENLELQGNMEELRSAFSNLIYNAVHYTPAKGCITVRWYQNQRGKHLQVQDTGIGIPKKYIPRITQRFYRVDKTPSPRQKAGTGLGLAIVKHVLMRHHGELSIESEVGIGSQFSCTFTSF